MKTLGSTVSSSQESVKISSTVGICRRKSLSKVNVKNIEEKKISAGVGACASQNWPNIPLPAWVPKEEPSEEENGVKILDFLAKHFGSDSNFPDIGINSSRTRLSLFPSHIRNCGGSRKQRGLITPIHKRYLTTVHTEPSVRPSSFGLGSSPNYRN